MGNPPSLKHSVLSDRHPYRKNPRYASVLFSIWNWLIIASIRADLRYNAPLLSWLLHRCADVIALGVPMFRKGWKR